MQTVTLEYAHAVGDYVTHKVMELNADPMQFVVMELLATQCHGGWQTHYRVRPVFTANGRDGRAGISSDLIVLAPFEVAPYPSSAELQLRREEIAIAEAAQAEAIRRDMLQVREQARERKQKEEEGAV